MDSWVCGRRPRLALSVVDDRILLNAEVKGDPAGDSSLVAPTFGARLVHPLLPRTSLPATAEGMFFSNDVRAFGGRIGLRFDHIEAAYRSSTSTSARRCSAPSSVSVFEPRSSAVRSEVACQIPGAAAWRADASVVVWSTSSR